jgi:peptide/nickel transport system substrate-binding protein/oligopeptide transport system substrate-binding protein
MMDAHLDGDPDSNQAFVDAIGTSTVVLVVIGSRWLGATEARGRPWLDDPDDAVRREVETALRLGKVVVPLLVDDAAMPGEDKLPETMRALTHRKAVAMDSAHLPRDIGRALEIALPALPARRADWRRRALYRGLVALTVLVLVAATLPLDAHFLGIRFGPGAATPTPPPAAPDSQQVLRVGADCLNTLDSQLVVNACDYPTTQLVFPRLVRLDDHLGVENGAASRIAISPDGTTYTFTLRQNLAWSDGTPITAGDFAFAINRALNPCTHAGAAYFLFPIADAAAFNGETCMAGLPSGAVTTLIGRSLQVTDFRTLVIHLHDAASYFLEALSYPTSWAVPQTLVSRYGATWTDHLADGGGLGGDMFKVTTWQPGSALVLQRNPRFWGSQPKLREVDFSVYATEQAMYAAYLAGTGDISNVAFAQYTSAKQRADFHQTVLLQGLSFALNWA